MRKEWASAERQPYHPRDGAPLPSVAFSRVDVSAELDIARRRAARLQGRYLPASRRASVRAASKAVQPHFMRKSSSSFVKPECGAADSPEREGEATPFTVEAVEDELLAEDAPDDAVAELAAEAMPELAEAPLPVPEDAAAGSELPSGVKSTPRARCPG